jgi:hypothetical protein
LFGRTPIEWLKSLPAPRNIAPTPGTKMEIGPFYFVLNAVAAAVLDNWAFSSPDEAVGRLSWTAIVGSSAGAD